MTQTGSMGLISAAFAAAPQAVHRMMGILAPLHKPTPAGLRVPNQRESLECDYYDLPICVGSTP
jgi:hypothetical protein